eukprot:TRINITY_DN8535_c0_g1_i4.p1 TRINITY_DN8535_c0_g1~~TRINITY_DN8535_c0_g1_i4.p1  ORF type:complete len:248 (+),score=34.34 TRINITY_DN8535_c0_g1_i4:58-801(+)
MESYRKANTMSNGNMKSTLLNPNVDLVIQALSAVVHSQIHERSAVSREDLENECFCLFDEETYVRERSDTIDEKRLQLLRSMPTVHETFDFIKALFDSSKFSPECCIISLVYINRLRALSGLVLHPGNWRPVVLCALLIAQKVWDDQSLTNGDFAFMYPFFSTAEVTAIERKFMELLDFNLMVKGKTYVQYYFELRNLVKGVEFPLRQLKPGEAEVMELRSRAVERNEQERAERLSMTASWLTGTSH